MRITKKTLVAAVVAATLVPATALASHADFEFHDVVDENKFYFDPVYWAFENGITTGKAPDLFKPDDPVTRGETVTFLKRYEDNIVAPADLALQAQIDALTDAQPFAVSATGGSTNLSGSDFEVVTSMPITVPVAGHVTVNSRATVTSTGGTNDDVVCVILRSTDTAPSTSISVPEVQWFEKGTNGAGSVAGTRLFEVEPGEHTFDLRCSVRGSTGRVNQSTLTGIFTADAEGAGFAALGSLGTAGASASTSSDDPNDG